MGGPVRPGNRSSVSDRPAGTPTERVGRRAPSPGRCAGARFPAVSTSVVLTRRRRRVRRALADGGPGRPRRARGTEIDELNVFPVPDGDTGTNLYLTLVAAVRGLTESSLRGGDTETPTPRRLMSTLAHGALLGARGNSGVILSPAAARRVPTALERRRALARRRPAARGRCRAGAPSRLRGGRRPGRGHHADRRPGGRRGGRGGGGRLGRHTRRRGAGRRGHRGRRRRREPRWRGPPTSSRCCAGPASSTPAAAASASCSTRSPRVVTGDESAPTEVRRQRETPGETSAWPRSGLDVEDPDAHGPAYEVMYLLDAPADGDRPAARARSTPLGDSLVVVGGEPTWNVHVHVDDVGAAIEAGIEAGRPHRIRVTHFRRRRPRRRPSRVPADGRRVVAVVAGRRAGRAVRGRGRHGRARRARDAGVDRRAARPACARPRPADVVVLPNDADSLAVAEAAAGKARDEGLRVAVIPTRASVQALAALAVHDPDRRFDDDVVAMTAAAGHPARRRDGRVRARRVTMAGVVPRGRRARRRRRRHRGDRRRPGRRGRQRARPAARRRRRAGHPGRRAPTPTRASPTAVADRLRGDAAARSTASLYDGGQPRYPLLIGVE